MLGEVKRSGGWLVPRRLVLRGKGSSWELDFSATEIDHPVVDIELDVTGGSVELRLPPGASVSTENIDVRLSSVEDRRRDAVARGQPHLRVVGRMLFSSFEVRGPRRNWSWWSR